MRILVRLIIFPLAGQRQEVRLGGGGSKVGKNKARVILPSLFPPNNDRPLKSTFGQKI